MLLKLMEQQNKNKPKGPIRHAALATFPCMLPTFTQTRPQILSVVPTRISRERRLLSGIYPVSDVPQDQTLVLAGIAHRMSDYLDAILRGLGNAELAYKEGAKQTMIWREEMETCGEQQGCESRSATIGESMLIPSIGQGHARGSFPVSSHWAMQSRPHRVARQSADRKSELRRPGCVR